MTQEEATPFGAELQPFPKDHEYHLEYVLYELIEMAKLDQPTNYHRKTGHVPQLALHQRHTHEIQPPRLRRQQRVCYETRNPP